MFTRQPISQCRMAPSVYAIKAIDTLVFVICIKNQTISSELADKQGESKISGKAGGLKM